MDIYKYTLLVQCILLYTNVERGEREREREREVERETERETEREREMHIQM